MAVVDGVPALAAHHPGTAAVPVVYGVVCDGIGEIAHQHTQGEAPCTQGLH
ncbi:MAG TPA: hypothetical protein VFW72_09195 [Aquabacterium sp.]|nr:hypothetical protein [Aquabacterium sp.]HEX5311967.1 hypothetical protein [Aquabacterium sp.]